MSTKNGAGAEGEREVVESGQEAKTEVKPRMKRKHSTIMGYSTTSVLRWMGARGRSGDEARTVLDHYGIDYDSVAVRLNEGRKGMTQWGYPAPITAEEQAELEAIMNRGKGGKVTRGSIGQSTAQAAQTGAGATKAEIYRQADSKGRVALPGFGNAPVIIKKIDETEYRVLRAKVIAEKDL